MGTDTRIAVIVFLFYLLNGLTSLVNDSIFLPPLFAEAWLLGGVSIIYFVLSIRSVFSVLFVLMAFYAFYTVYSPVLPHKIPDTLQQCVLWIPLLLPLTLYSKVLISFARENKVSKIAWTIHMTCFILSLAPVWIENTSMLSLVAGIIQAFTGIIMLSNENIGMAEKNWEKKTVLVMMLIVFFDVTAYVYFMNLPVT